MSTEKVAKLEKNNSGPVDGFVKLYAHGKLGLLFKGPLDYQKVAEECFNRALKVKIMVDDITFVRAMRERGSPEAVINQVLNSYSVFDEVHLGGLSLR